MRAGVIALSLLLAGGSPAFAQSRTAAPGANQFAWREGPPVYSDINFMLLGIAIERLTGRKLADQRLPAGLSFRPDPAHAAATERCTWRGRVTWSSSQPSRTPSTRRRRAPGSLSSCTSTRRTGSCPSRTRFPAPSAGCSRSSYFGTLGGARAPRDELARAKPALPRRVPVQSSSGR